MFHINLVFVVLALIAFVLNLALFVRIMRPAKPKLPPLTPSMLPHIQEHGNLGEYGAMTEQRRTGVWERAGEAEYRRIPTNVRDTGAYDNLWQSVRDASRASAWQETQRDTFPDPNGPEKE